MMFDLAKMADRYAEREDVSGIVVTHGTDTLEETAYSVRFGSKTKQPDLSLQEPCAALQKQDRTDRQISWRQ